MITQENTSNRRGLHRAASAVLAAAGLLVPALAQDISDPVDRSFYFIERSAQATELFNQNRLQDALPIFQELAAGYSDLDEDGYVALGVGDCLLELGQLEAARAAYAQVKALRPDLQEEADLRLVGVELKGEVSDELIAWLRTAAEAPDADRAGMHWILGRALQKRAVSLVSEAAKAFRAAAEGGGAGGRGQKAPSLTSHAALLDELGQDLSRLVNQVEKAFELRGLNPQAGADEPTPEVVAERVRSEHLLRGKDGRRLEFQVRQEEGSCEKQVLVNGNSLELSPEERQLLQRHQERINEILMKAASRASEK